MKYSTVFVVVLGLLIVSKVDADCDADAGLKCTQSYAKAATDAGTDKAKQCAAAKDYSSCLKDADCLTKENNDKIKEALDKYGCGAVSISVNLALILTAVVVTVKNLF